MTIEDFQILKYNFLLAFKKIPPNARRKNVDLCLITHFHLDHCGALPYFTELHGIQNDYNTRL